MAFASVLSLFFVVERNSRNFLTTQVLIRGNRKMALGLALVANCPESSAREHKGGI